MNSKNTWDLEYSRKGYIWGGRGPVLPPLPRGSLALDIGCGDGKALRAALESGWNSVGMDTSLPAICLAMQRGGGAQEGAFLRGDAEHLPFRDDIFDIVLAVHVLAHIDAKGRRDAAREIVRVVRPGGTFLFLDYGTGDMRMAGGHPAGENTRKKAGGIVTHFFTCDEVRDLFTGLRIVDIRYDRRSVRIRGQECSREEVRGLFEKE